MGFYHVPQMRNAGGQLDVGENVSTCDAGSSFRLWRVAVGLVSGHAFQSFYPTDRTEVTNIHIR